MGRKSREQLDAERAEQTAAMTNSPEFKDAVSQAVAAAVGPLMEKLAAARGDAGVSSDDGDFASKLAMAISQLTDQGTGRSRVAPEILAQRQKAREEMVNLIIEARAEGKVATYQLRNKIVLNERLIEPIWIAPDHTARPTEIDFGGVPNEAMVPVNETAKAIHNAFTRSIGSVEAKHRIADDRLGITPKGVVVRNSAVTNAIQRQTPDVFKGDGPMPAYEEPPQVNGGPTYEPLRVNHENSQGRYVEKHILGTVQPPARQTA